jgi:3-methyl-2-oxobutanoate hydroxymethyltransferase
VWHDLLGITSGHVPSFVKQYASLGEAMLTALQAYVADVRAGRFPEPRHAYHMAQGETLSRRDPAELKTTKP